ncbi:MAG: GNAT family N-acetyltransferase [Proteobacteria bacterium]|nr:GNAT family N-acetyltransferase [Pseudomonadota bacterium]
MTILPMIQIKKAQKKDIPDIALLWKDKLQAFWTKEMIETSFKKEGVYTVIAVCAHYPEASQKNVGFLMASLEGDAELYALVINKAYQRQGIGELLLKNLIDFLKNKKIFSLFLEVAEDNEKARTFYEKQGFKKIGERLSYYSKKMGGKDLRVKALVLRKNF